MNRKTEVDDFLAQTSLAVVGVSRGGKKFGNTIAKELAAKGYRVYPINPRAKSIEGQTCYPNLAALPETPHGVVTVVPPAVTEEIVQQARAAGIRRVWMQQGSESEAAVRYGRDNGMTVIDGECILMFAEPAAFYHRFHRFLWKLLGKLPR